MNLSAIVSRMIIELVEGIEASDLTSLKHTLSGMGHKPFAVKTQRGFYLVSLENGLESAEKLGWMPGVRRVHLIGEPYQLVSSKWKDCASEIVIDAQAVITPNSLTLIAGPCAIESEDQIDKVLTHLQTQGIRFMRGGVFKPRTSPYSFRGMGLEGLKLWSRMAKDRGIRIVSEVLAPDQVQQMCEYVDVFQVGARNSQNFSLLGELGKVSKPVMLKRGLSGTLDELLQAAEYVFSSGNEDIILCERGIRTFENAYRNTLDLNAIPVLKEKTHLPVFVDPSHGIGMRRFVEPVALAAVIAGADGLMYEVHPDPNSALSDGQQTLNFEESAGLVKKARELAAVRARWQEPKETPRLRAVNG